MRGLGLALVSWGGVPGPFGPKGGPELQTSVGMSSWRLDLDLGRKAWKDKMALGMISRPQAGAGKGGPGGKPGFQEQDEGGKPTEESQSEQPGRWEGNQMSTPQKPEAGAAAGGELGRQHPASPGGRGSSSPRRAHVPRGSVSTWCLSKS